MKKLIVVLLLFFSLLSVSYAKTPKAKVWVNSKVECCGVTNPIENFDWLDFKQNVNKHDFSCVLLFKNNDTQEYSVAIHNVDGMRTGMFLVAMDGITLYDCNGVKLDKGTYFNGKPRYDLYKNSITTQDKKLNKRINKVNKRYNKLEKKLEKARVKITESAPNLQPPRPCESCEEFMKNYTLVDILAYSYVK
jgi:hypothetical protein